MIKVFYGDDRLRATSAIKTYLGETYEIIDSADLTPADLPSIFLGITLFDETRNILLRDFTVSKPLFDALENYLNTPHNIALLETKLDKRSAAYKTLKDKIEFLEFAPKKDKNFGLVFYIYRIAKRDGKKAVTTLRTIEQDNDPIMFFGLLISQALKDFSANPKNAKEKRVLRELSKTDLDLKSSSTQPWLLIESFLLRLSSL